MKDKSEQGSKGKLEPKLKASELTKLFQPQQEVHLM
jgi:hypothetical protein